MKFTTDPQYRHLTDAEQDWLLVRRFRLSESELYAARVFRSFALNMLGLRLHVGQVAFAGTVLARHPVSPSTARFLTLMLTSGNRAGKTSLLAVLIIYSCLRKLNRNTLPEDASQEQAIAWLRTEYHWYHFGISQEVADLVYADMVRILAGTHEGQMDYDDAKQPIPGSARGCPLTKQGEIATWDAKERGEYRWIRFVPEVGGAEVHFRTTGEKALGQLGRDMHGVSFDEAGIERNLDFLIKEVFNLRRLGTGGQLIMASTPSEDLGSAFADNWELGNYENRDRLPSWQSMRMSTRDNVGYGITKNMFDRLTADMDDRTVKQNIDGYFLQAKAAYFNGENVDETFVSGMPEVSPVVKNGMYLQGVDPAKTQDSAWSIILQVVPDAEEPDRPFLVGVHAAQLKGQKSTERLVGMCADGFNRYDNPRLRASCYTATDATGFGGKMFREALDFEVPNVTNVEFGGTIQKKRKLLGDLRTLIDEGRLILPKTGIWMQVRRQLLGYRLEDRGIEQDAVMALVCAVYLLRRTSDGTATRGDFDLFGMYTDEHERREALDWLRPVKRR